MNSGHSRRICVWAISNVCVWSIIYVGRVEWNTGSAATLLWYIPWNFRNCSVSLRIFPWVEAVMSLMSPILGLSGAVPSFSSFSLFIACFVLVAHNIVELQYDREWVENESVDKDYPQKVTLEIHCCNHQYPLKISSQNIVFVPGELSRASRNRYVIAPYQFHNTFLGIPESVRRRSVEHTRTDSKIHVCKFLCNSVSGDDVDHILCCGAW